MHKIEINEHLGCRKVEEFLMAYLEKELSLWSRIRFRFHLLMCGNCAKYIADYKKAIDLGQQLFSNPDAIATGKVPDEILHAILSSGKTH
ncbi:MAG: zf-HC2 domain-containing protein [Proteobacteria bacterium]|nr:hypothetical protein [Pseudomonadota bacterium]NOG59704.1 zf-HC2 domain-containing protein [Pseudomonadota bacterium]